LPVSHLDAALIDAAPPTVLLWETLGAIELPDSPMIVASEDAVRKVWGALAVPRVGDLALTWKADTQARARFSVHLLRNLRRSTFRFDCVAVFQPGVATVVFGSRTTWAK
jgi:hypothetical protein